MAKKSKPKSSKSAAKGRFSPLQKLWFATSVGVIVGVFTGLLIAFAVAAGNATDYHFASSYVGLSESKAAEKARTKGFDYRVVKRDGESQPIRDDYNDYRLNFTVYEGQIVKAEFY